MNVYEENNKLKELLKAALTNPNSQEWIIEAAFYLNPPSKEETKTVQRKWEGEKCLECGHSCVTHIKGKGFCCQANCGCNEFIPSGEET